MRLPWRREPDPLADLRERREWLATVEPEKLLFIYQPGMERWSPERSRAEGELVRALALADLDNIIAAEAAA